jgi:hypothetical protein
MNGVWRSRPPHLRRLHGLDGYGVADPLPPVMSYLHRVMHGHGLDRETVLSNLHAREKGRNITLTRCEDVHAKAATGP